MYFFIRFHFRSSSESVKANKKKVGNGRRHGHTGAVGTVSANLTEALMTSGKMSGRRSRSTLPSLSSDVKKDIQANNETAAERLQRALLESQQQDDSGRHRQVGLRPFRSSMLLAFVYDGGRSCDGV